MKFFKRPVVRRVIRYAGFGGMAIIALLAGAIVTSLTIDLGPAVRERAEIAGGNYIERPLHIGRLSIHVLTGRFIVEDIKIDGLLVGDRPFFTAKQVAVSLDWSTAFRREPEFLVTSVELTDWQMLVEKWDGKHNFPKFTRDSDEPEGPKRFTTTVRRVHASRGQFAFEDHEAPWSIVCPNLDLTITNLPNYHGDVTFNGGTVTIQVNPGDPNPPAPMSGDMTWTFEVVPQTDMRSLRATIRSTHPWLTMETTGSTALSPGNSPPTEISTHGEFNSPRGCRGTFGSVGTAQATRIEADFTGTDCQLATFSGRVVLTKQ